MTNSLTELPTLTGDSGDVDMSPEAVDARLRRGAELWRLAMELRDADVIGRIDEDGALVVPDQTPQE